MEDNLTDEMRALYLGESEDGEGDGKEGGEEKKRQKRGGKGVIKAKKKTEKVHKVSLSRAPRGKKKYVTVVTGLATYDVDLKKASKMFGSRFACGSSVTGDDEIVIQGDVKDDLFDFIPEKWPEIDEDTIEDLGDLKR
jgi:density-regulated protein DRP1